MKEPLKKKRGGSCRWDQNKNQSYRSSPTTLSEARVHPASAGGRRQFSWLAVR